MRQVCAYSRLRRHVDQQHFSAWHATLEAMSGRKLSDRQWRQISNWRRFDFETAAAVLLRSSEWDSAYAPTINFYSAIRDVRRNWRRGCCIDEVLQCGSRNLRWGGRVPSHSFLPLLPFLSSSFPFPRVSLPPSPHLSPSLPVSSPSLRSRAPSTS